MPGSPAISVGEGSYTVRTGRFVAIHFGALRYNDHWGLDRRGYRLVPVR
jgi:hypothetical protein